MMRIASYEASAAARKADAAESRIKVLIVEDHELAREGIKSALASGKDFQIVAETDGVDEALTLADALVPDVVLLDIALAGGNGMDLAAELRVRHPAIRIVVLTAHEEQQYVRRFARLGVAGYLVKSASCADLRCAVRSAATSERCVEVPPRASGTRRRAGKSKVKFTARELEVLDHMVRGLKYRQIAEALGLSPRTIEVFADHIFQKLGVRTRTQAALLALSSGLVPAGAKVRKAA